MSSIQDFQRLSNYVGAVVDRKLTAVSSGVTAATGYLRTLVNQSQGFAGDALRYSNEARDRATDADTSAASSLIVYNNFTSLYIGLQTNDPVRSQIGNPILASAFYIRQSDGRLRYAASVAANGTPTWADATVAADPASVVSAGAGIFLSLSTTGSQSVRGPIVFQGTLIGPRVSSWSSQQLTTATDVNDRFTTTTNALNAEITRATAAETSINNAKVSKLGDTMGGTLTLSSAGELPSLNLNNTSGRNYRIHSSSDGRLRFIDSTVGVERFALDAAGLLSVGGPVVAGAYVAANQLIANRSDGFDPTLDFRTANVTRWNVGRSIPGSRFYIARYNSSGVFIDTPISVSESDGALTLNTMTVTGDINTNGQIRINRNNPAVFINNSTGTGDSVVQYANGGIVRWTVGRSASSSIYYINRMSDQGQYVDTPFSINESSGWVNTNNIQTSRIVASTSVSALQMYATSNGTGQNIAIGDDAWIGDSNLINGITIRGQQDFNAGYIRFGNSAFALGCNPNDGTLRYNGDPVVTALNYNSYLGSNIGNYLRTVQVTNSVSAPIFYAQSNGTGTAIAVGDDAWIGDGNIGSGITIRGQSDFNSGFVKFGNVGQTLGCNANDSTLYYGSSAVMTGANFGSFLLSNVSNFAITNANPSISLNNNGGNTDNAIIFNKNGRTAWTLGRSFGGSLYMARFNVNTGSYIDTPLYISEADGVVYSSKIFSSAYVSTPILYATSSGTGTAIAIGDDAWIGDTNIPNGVSIRGQSDFNSGFVRFGNSPLSLGCNANDSTLRYNNSEIITAYRFQDFFQNSVGDTSQVITANRIPSYISNLFSETINANGRAIRLPNGYMIQYGMVYVGTDGQSTVTFPVQFTDENTVSVLGLVNNSSYVGAGDTGAVTYFNISKTTMGIANNSFGATVSWSVIGK